MATPGGPILSICRKRATGISAAAQLPLNIGFLWELEEEIGSEHFASAITRHAERLKTDAIVVSDTIWITRGKPSSPAGLRGMQSFRLTLRTATNDLHSGITGGV